MKIEQSSRLTYRLMTPTDTQLLFELDQDPKVMQFINGGVSSSMHDIQKVMIPRLKLYINPQKAWGIWQVNVSDTNEYIGWILVRPFNFFSDNPQFDNIELGWRFKSHTWGNGYATEAASHVMSALSVDESIHSFCAIAVPENKSSLRIMQKIGMRYIKTYTHKDPLGEWFVQYYERKNQNEVI